MWSGRKGERGGGGGRRRHGGKLFDQCQTSVMETAGKISCKWERRGAEQEDRVGVRHAWKTKQARLCGHPHSVVLFPV